MMRRWSGYPTSLTWMAAARGACVNGDHVTERRYRDTARLIRRLPPLTDRARCLVARKAGTTRR